MVCFDGECPICKMGANLFKIKQHVRMVLKYEGKLYQGDEALTLMVNIGDACDRFNGFNKVLFRSKTLSKLCYPYMKLTRDIAITLKGAGNINNLER